MCFRKWSWIEQLGVEGESDRSPVEPIEAPPTPQVSFRRGPNAGVGAQCDEPLSRIFSLAGTRRRWMVIGWLATIPACHAGDDVRAQTARVPEGDAVLGQTIVASGAYGCTGCHAFPGIAMPRGAVGPPLDGMASRAFIAGQLPNEPAVLVAFLQNPSALVPATGMPDVRMSLDEARDVAAYLYTLDASHAP